MNIIKWTIVVVVGIISATAIGITFLVTNSVNTVYDSNQLFTKSHNIFIDTATAKCKHQNDWKIQCDILSCEIDALSVF